MFSTHFNFCAFILGLYWSNFASFTVLNNPSSQTKPVCVKQAIFPPLHRVSGSNDLVPISRNLTGELLKMINGGGFNINQLPESSAEDRDVCLNVCIYGNLPLHIEFVKFTWPDFESRGHVCQLFGVSWWCAWSLLCFHAFFWFLNESHFQIYIYLQTTCQDLNVCVLLSAPAAAPAGAPAASHRNSFPGRAGGQVWLTLRAFYLFQPAERTWSFLLTSLTFHVAPSHIGLTVSHPRIHLMWYKRHVFSYFF